MSTVYIGVGSNTGDLKANVTEAVRRLDESEGISVEGRSEFYMTSPVGGPPQGEYLNGVLKIETETTPYRLLDIVKDIEKTMGRVPAKKDFPRIMDLDILLFDDRVIKEERLTIPHPRMHERDFVLRGLSEIAPDAVHPELGKTVKELSSEASGSTKDIGGSGDQGIR
ncbi:MAG: 2-amino-4-hydroxy-6-hydroxymethyldihydropteridine diphosphokinase [Candidatus Tantalella remota]|nr:2-amino-4-hydroxy-6-hydroxymethyldihydropteridine diphosphokinase [Candidatus Tantalella remota]